LIDEPPMLARDGGFVKHEYHPSLDEFRRLRDESKRFIAQMQATYAAQTNIPSLKIKHNSVLGYFVEIAKRFEGNITANFIHRQTISDCLRYSTVELGELEHKILHAADKVLKIELDIFAELKQRILEQSDQIVSAARAIACLDLYLSFAEIAHMRHYVRPIMTNNKELQIIAGRHPVVEEMQKRKGENFIHNDCALGDLETLWLITGPNMAGKSTFLRQNALITIMAHVGCYVPATSATIGVIDKCFSRVGAADDLARGHSTFMVEMVETATILNQATSRSLVILDEIGRGTATYDGMAIAWAVVEHLHNQINCLGLFATHYHELTKLTNALPALSCYTMQVKEWRGEVIFCIKWCEEWQTALTGCMLQH
jgi:DNA mismatch repair protein MutS